jgi:GABA(A) receptor-associated protein
MSSNFDFKKNHKFEDRQKEAERILKKYPDRVPIIVEKAAKSSVPNIDKHKYLVPNDITVGQFCYIIRKRIKLGSEQGLFLFINNTLPATSALMSQIYKEHKESCGFVYCLYSGESCFGN